MFFRRPFSTVYSPDDAGGGGGGGGEVATPPAAPPSPAPANLTGGEKPGAGGEGDIHMTSPQLAERLARAERAAVTNLLKTLGLQTVEDLNALIAQNDPKGKGKDEKKAADTLKELQDKLVLAEQKVQDAASQALQAEVRSEAMGLMAGRFANPRAAFKLLDLSKVEKKDGAFTGLAEAVEKLATDEPWTLITTPNQKPKGPLIGATNPDGKPVAPSEADQRARYFGGQGSGGFFSEGKVVLPSGK